MQLLVALILGLSLIAGCVPPGSSTPTPKPDPLAEAVRRLEAAQSYGFRVSGGHRWTFEGHEEVWGFSGWGEAHRGGTFSSEITGTADTYLKVTIGQGGVSCEDTRGPVAPPLCATTFGGVRPGAAPYTIIAYLRYSTRLGEVQKVSLEGRDALYMKFQPRMDAVAAIDEAHARALERVTFRQGEIWIADQERLPLRETTVIEYRPEGANAETITTTIDFMNYVEAER